MMNSIKLPNLLQSNYKGLQLYTISDTKFSEKEMFVNTVEKICSLINSLRGLNFYVFKNVLKMQISLQL